MVVGLARCWFGCDCRYRRLGFGRRVGPANESEGARPQHHDHAIARARSERPNIDEDPAGNDPTSNDAASGHTEPGHTEPDHTEPDHTEPDGYDSTDNPAFTNGGTSDNAAANDAGDHGTPTNCGQQPGFLRRRMRGEAANGSVESGHTCT